MSSSQISKFFSVSAVMLVLIAATGCGNYDWFYKAQYPKETLAEDSPMVYKDTLDSEKKKEVKKKKPPRNVFYGHKTRKAYTKLQRKKQLTLELFYTLKYFIPPDPYVKDIYWFHTKKKKIFQGRIPDLEKPFARIMHGPYKRVVNKKTVEEGNFYIGTKHQRWVKYQYGDEEMLNEKDIWYKGFPNGSMISYYDADKKRLKEVIPMKDGQKHGDYYFFNEKGQIIVAGRYEYNVKVGVWREFHGDLRNRLKKQIQEAENPWVKDFKAYTLTDHDANGVVTYDWNEEQKKKAKAATPSIQMNK